ncbi:ABC transporter permease, partial [Parabacteroides sp. OttesenSCG-928-G06]|nr:ABC transporter permease [Parabacteroides sp. OttesenSCG-928-G06]
HYPQVTWEPRIYFGGLLDIPDVNGETLAQGPVAGTAYDLLSHARERERLRLESALVDGRLIQQEKEALVSIDFAERFQVSPGDTLTFFGTTMYGSMSFTNLTVAGIVRFGNMALDRGAILVDISYARTFLDMDNAATEVFGYLPGEHYDEQVAESIKKDFNSRFPAWEEDEYAPQMLQLADQNGMGDMLLYMDSVAFVMALLLVLALSIVLWNTGVLGGIRRYNEFGIRLAMGEPQGHIYRTMLLESFIIGIAGSVMGTALGLLLALYMRKHGLDYGSLIDTISMMIDPMIRAEITPRMFWIGFIPGVISMLIGTALAGMAVYKRKTAELFRELS